MSDRVYCPQPPVDGRWVVEGDEAHHLANVRRLGPGDLVQAFDGRSPARTARIVAVGRRRVELEAIAEGPIRPDSHPDADPVLILGAAVPKGDRFDWLVEKATEIGVAALVPLIAGRSVVEPRSTKLERLRRTVVEACKQSGRDLLMRVEEPRSLADWLRGDAGIAARFLADVAGEPLAPRLVGPPPASATLAIGPEGGFTDDERESARSFGWSPVGLGPTTLRVETAAVVGSAVLLTWMRRRTAT